MLLDNPCRQFEDLGPSSEHVARRPYFLLVNMFLVLKILRDLNAASLGHCLKAYNTMECMMLLLHQMGEYQELVRYCLSCHNSLWLSTRLDALLGRRRQDPTWTIIILSAYEKATH